MTEETESCTLESAVRGHHVYKTTSSPAIGQVLQVGAEDSNAYDRYAVATCLRDTVGAEDSNAYDRYRRPGFNCVVKQLRFWLFKVDCEFTENCDLRVLHIGNTCVIYVYIAF